MKGLTLLISVLFALGAMVDSGLRFSVDDTGVFPDDIPVIAPWRVVTLDPDYGGQWMVAGDLDGDGQPEIVSAENFNEGDVHLHERRRRAETGRPDLVALGKSRDRAQNMASVLSKTNQALSSGFS